MEHWLTQLTPSTSTNKEQLDTHYPFRENAGHDDTHEIAPLTFWNNVHWLISARHCYPSDIADAHEETQILLNSMNIPEEHWLRHCFPLITFGATQKSKHAIY